MGLWHVFLPLLAVGSERLDSVEGSDALCKVLLEGSSLCVLGASGGLAWKLMELRVEHACCWAGGVSRLSKDVAGEAPPTSEGMADPLVGWVVL